MRDDVRAWVGLGANLDDPAAQIATAVRELAALPRTRLAALSCLYRTPPMGPSDQPDYLNAVAGLDTTLDPETLLEGLQAIEQAHRRVRGERWGPRTLDLDLLLYGNERIATARLTVPHPGIAARVFVLAPLAEVAPDLSIPGLGPVAALRAARAGDPIDMLGPVAP